MSIFLKIFFNRRTILTGTEIPEHNITSALQISVWPYNLIPFPQWHSVPGISCSQGMIIHLCKVLTMWWHNPVNTGVLHSFHQDTSMEPEITGLLFFAAQQANPLSASWTLHSWDHLAQALMVQHQTILFEGSRKTMTSCLWYGIYSLMSQSCSVPSCCKGTSEGLASFPTPILHPLAVELHRNDTKLQKKREQSPKTSLLLTTKMLKNCISFHPFET